MMGLFEEIAQAILDNIYLLGCYVPPSNNYIVQGHVCIKKMRILSFSDAIIEFIIGGIQLGKGISNTKQ